MRDQTTSSVTGGAVQRRHLGDRDHGSDYLLGDGWGWERGRPGHLAGGCGAGERGRLARPAGPTPSAEDLVWPCT